MEERLEMEETRATLRIAIGKAQRDSWRILSEDIDTNVWGEG